MKRARPKGTPAIEFLSSGHRPLLIKVWWYKWEFLRRNPEYKADYSEFMARFGAWFRRRGFWFDTKRRLRAWTKKDEGYFRTEIAPVITRLCQKWQVATLCPPDWQFGREDGRHQFRRGEFEFLPTSLEPGQNWAGEEIQALLDLGFTGVSGVARRHRNHFLVEFDLELPMKDLLECSKRALRSGQESYRTELREQKVRPSAARRRFEDYDDHLKAWDLSQEGKSAAEIARILFGSERLYGKQRVREHLKAARKLINERYQEIR